MNDSSEGGEVKFVRRMPIAQFKKAVDAVYTIDPAAEVEAELKIKTSRVMRVGRFLRHLVKSSQPKVVTAHTVEAATIETTADISNFEGSADITTMDDE